MRDVWLGLLLLAAPSALWAHEPPDKKTTAVPLYTNSDLERVAPFRDQTGVASVPGPEAVVERTTSKAAPSASRGRGETYWRHEADRVRQQVRKLEAQAATVRSRIEAEKARPQQHGKSAKRGPDLEARLTALRLEARQLEDDLLDRARRERALPGWLR